MNPEETAPAPSSAPRKRRAGRSRTAAGPRRDLCIWVRLSEPERAQLLAKAEALHLTAAGYLREAALARRLKPPPVAAINREHYIELARLVEDLNELRRLASAGQVVTVADALLQRLHHEVGRLRMELIGAVPRAEGTGRTDSPPANASPHLP